MNKKEESVLGLVPLESPPALSMRGAQSFFDGSHVLTEREEMIIERLYEQELVIDAITAKTIFGMQKMDEIHLYSMSEFLETVAYIDGAKRQALGTDYQAAVAEFSTYLTRLAAHRLLGADEIGVSAIGGVIQDRVLPPHEHAEPRRRGFLLRLLGG